MKDIEHNQNDEPTKAVIYCRVSTKRQKEEGHGLDSQEHRCRQYAAANGYEVEAVFPDDVSGGGDFMKRPGMVALLAYLDARPGERYVVIFDDLKRYARDTEFHLRLRRIMAERGAIRECLNFNFEDSPEGKFFEILAAAQGELEREQHGRQVSQKMHARVENGYYCFGKIPGYRYVDAPNGGTIMVPEEPAASVIREALEGMASGHFQTTAEVQRFFGASGAIRKNRNGEVNWQTVRDILRRPLYAGYIGLKKEGGRLRPAKHEPLVSYATWRKVQDRLDSASLAPARKDFNADFPLRGFVCCASCGHPMTAAWSKGRSAHYPYYKCHQRACESRGKSVRKEKVEAEFEAVLKKLKPSPTLLNIVGTLFADRWDQEGRNGQDRAAAARAEIGQLETRIDKLVGCIMEAENARVIKAYEKQITALDDEKLRLNAIAADAGRPRSTFEGSFRTAWAFLSNPWKLWASGILDHQRLVLRLAFSGPLRYCRNEGFRTAAIAEPLRLLGAFAASGPRMVGAAGIEPATPTMST